MTTEGASDVRRSGLESAALPMIDGSRFSMITSTKTFHGGVNEVLLKCLAWNLTRVVHAVHELGIKPTFWSRQEVA